MKNKYLENPPWKQGFTIVSVEEGVVTVRTEEGAEIREVHEGDLQDLTHESAFVKEPMEKVLEEERKLDELYASIEWAEDGKKEGA